MENRRDGSKEALSSTVIEDRSVMLLTGFRARAVRWVDVVGVGFLGFRHRTTKTAKSRVTTKKLAAAATSAW